LSAVFAEPSAPPGLASGFFETREAGGFGVIRLLGDRVTTDTIAATISAASVALTGNDLTGNN
jgi:hypothetical protein